MTEPAPPRLDGWLLAGALLALYCLLGQGSLYKVDGQALLWLSKDGATQHPYHTFYLYGLEQLKTVCAPLGLGLFETARLYSALSTALGMVFVHAACRQLGLGRLGCNVATLLVGTSPAVVFFATVVEVHGPFSLFAGAAWWGTALLLRRRTRWSAPLVGLCIGVAYLSHPTAALMVFMLPIFCLEAARLPGAEPFSLRRSLVFTALAGAAMAVFILVVPRLLRAGLGTQASAEAAWHMLTNYPGDELIAPLRTAEIFAEEWLLPFFPATFLALASAFTSRARLPLLLLMAGLVPHLLVAQLMLKGYSEGGAYLLPAALPTVILAMVVLARHRWLIVPAILTSAALAVVQVERHDASDRPRAFAAGLAELSGEQPFLLIAGHPHDIEGMLLCFEDLRPHWLGTTLGKSEPDLQAELEKLDDIIAELEKLGLATFMSTNALESLRSAARTDQWMLSHDPVVLVPERGRAAQQVLDHLAEHYELTPVNAAGFDGYRLRKR